MELKSVCDLIKVVSDSKLDYAEIKIDDIYIKLEKNNGSSKYNLSNSNFDEKFDVHKVEKTEASDACLNDLKNEELSNEIDSVDESIKEIVSPLVGTFYKSPSPGAESFVKIGDKVKKGDVLCIIEAMKLMNEIEADVDGEIVEITADNEQMVEYNQTLFRIKI